MPLVCLIAVTCLRSMVQCLLQAWNCKPSAMSSGAQSSLNGSVGISLHQVCFNPALRIVDSGHVGTVMCV